ncbi:MAG: N-acetylmuramoyl-L-alanine amidase [Sphingobacteriales bacterium]
MAKLKIRTVKKYLITVKIFLIAAICCIANGIEPPSAEETVQTIVIDAGHGGHDGGNIGTGTSKLVEKDIALNVSLQLGKYLEDNLEDVNVVYTRKKDEFIKLVNRAKVANVSQADLFISIHCNAAENTDARGTETFTMGLHRTQKNLEVAKRENSVILLEDDYEANYDGFDPNSPEAYIIFSMFQNAYLERSLNLASKVENQFEKRVQRKSRGVKQAGFLVLYQTSMPSVLVEIGFLTNKSDENFLNTEQGQAYMASAIYRAVKEYKFELEGKDLNSSN